jgi:hypothetical protein
MWRNFFRKTLPDTPLRDSEDRPLPPYALLDRSFRLDDGTGVKVIGWQYGGKHLRVPFVVRCRVETGEVIIIDPDYIRQCATDITPFVVKREAYRHPHVPTEEEVVRVVGWVSRTRFDGSRPTESRLRRIVEEDRKR